MPTEYYTIVEGQETTEPRKSNESRSQALHFRPSVSIYIIPHLTGWLTVRFLSICFNERQVGGCDNNNNFRACPQIAEVLFPSHLDDNQFNGEQENVLIFNWKNENNHDNVW